MEKQTYNGWTNYATWRVNLEIFDGFDPREHFTDAANDEAWQEDLAENLKVYADDYIIYNNESSANSLMADYARAFLSDVNWHEIAQHMIADYAEA
jgi:hypothetical protein